MATSFPERSRAFAWTEAMIVIVVLTVLSAIAVPRFIDSGAYDKESRLKADLNHYRSAIEAFHLDTGVYPLRLSDLASLSAPAAGVDEYGKLRSIKVQNWGGPYLGYLGNDPLSDAPFDYSTTPPYVGWVTSSCTGLSRKGIPYKAW
jgi:type II secretory pathway pseudopilin PulG